MPEPVQMTTISSSAEMDTKGMLATAKDCNRNTTATATVPKRRVLLRSSLQNRMSFSYCSKVKKDVNASVFYFTAVAIDSPEIFL